MKNNATCIFNDNLLLAFNNWRNTLNYIFMMIDKNALSFTFINIIGGLIIEFDKRES